VLKVEPTGRARFIMLDAGLAGTLGKAGATWTFIPDGKARPIIFTVKGEDLDSEYGTLVLAPRDAVEAAARERFASIEVPKGLSWSVRVTPALPEAWRAREVVYVLYGAARAPGLADGEHILAPWGVARYHDDGKVVTEARAVPASERGIQGVHPVAAAAGPGITEVEPELIALLHGGALPAQPPARIKEAYCTWKADNGVIAGALGEQQAFFAWLGCP
jgi:hypothetical protein